MGFKRFVCSGSLMAVTFTLSCLTVGVLGFLGSGFGGGLSHCTDFGFSTPAHSGETIPYQTDVVEIYRATLRHQLKSFDKVVVNEWSSSGGPRWDDKMDGTAVPGSDMATYKSFLAANRQPSSLRPALRTEPKVTFWTEDDIQKTFFGRHGMGWGRFYKTHTGIDAIVTFSKVGFNEAHDEALIYYSYQCGNLCGGGMYVNLVKRADGWRVVNTHALWAS